MRYDGTFGRVAGFSLLAVGLGAMLVAVAILSFSVTVSGHSMEPTLRQGDRLEVDLLHRHDVRRFDIVEATEPGPAAAGGGTRIVKRVIGLPGDRVLITGGSSPQVLLQPANASTTYRVDNSTWPARIGAAIASCCAATGQAVASTDGATWATVPAGSYWLIGDNWGGSTDSRTFGFVPADRIDARLTWRLTPASGFGRLAQPARLVPLP